MKRYLLITLVCILLISLGFIRESIFKNFNEQIYYFQSGSDEFVKSEFYSTIFKNSNYNQLVWSKWIFTILFTIIFYLLSIFGLRTFFNSWQHTKITTIIYGSIVTISAVIFLGGWTMGHIGQAYRFARIFMGAVQSPFILLMLIPGIKLLSKKASS